MEWGDLAKQVISLGAPMLGTALGGPLGGVAGEILAKAVGSVTITPTAVQTALPSVDSAKLAEAEAQWAEMIRAEAETQRTAISETQQTIRTEIASSDPVQRWWRPAYAFELTIECAALWIVPMRASSSSLTTSRSPRSILFPRNTIGTVPTCFRIIWTQLFKS